MATYNTPGVYIEEVPQLPLQVDEVGTDVPVFIGCTAAGGDAWPREPVPIDSLAAFEQRFGAGPTDRLTVRLSGTGSALQALCDPPEPSHLLHAALRLFFANGGRRCFVVPAGSHAAPPALDALREALDAAAGLEGAALLLCPDAVRLSMTDYAALTAAMLAHCARRGDRFAILDLHPAAATLGDQRALLGSDHLHRGAAYHPALRSSFGPPPLPQRPLPLRQAAPAAAPEVTVVTPEGERLRLAQLTEPTTLDAVRAAVAAARYLLPPGGAVAGAYAATDLERGVWKAPAPVALIAVEAPARTIDDTTQASMNVDPTAGKSINAIRAFPGKGILVWGARTLAGNDPEWRYVPVRRFVDQVEASLRRSFAWAVFEPHEAGTWARLRAQAENHLTLKWRAGALAGSKPEQAFFARCGLGQTMTPQDIENGVLIVEIGLAAVRPAEFIVLRIALATDGD